jgi:hypothetical protein
MTAIGQPPSTALSTLEFTKNSLTQPVVPLKRLPKAGQTIHCTEVVLEPSKNSGRSTSRNIGTGHTPDDRLSSQNRNSFPGNFLEFPSQQSIGKNAYFTQPGKTGPEPSIATNFQAHPRLYRTFLAPP